MVRDVLAFELQSSKGLFVEGYCVLVLLLLETIVALLLDRLKAANQ